MNKLACLLTAAAFAWPAAAVNAAPIITVVGANLSKSFSFSYLGSTFTFGATGDLFNPLSVKDSANGAISSFGGFLGIPVAPSSDFVDRGIVSYGPGTSFAPFTSTTTVPFSNGGNFLGLRVTSAGKNYYGFAYTTDTQLRGYGFETAADTAITAAAVPEPASWALLVVGFALTGAAVRRRRTTVSYA